jgi:Putative addiction module component
MSLPPDVRKHVALRLLESVDPHQAFDLASESWFRTEAAAAYDAVKADPSHALAAKEVRLGLRGQVGRVVDDDSIDVAWTNELSSRVDDIRSGKVTTVPGEQVFADIAARRAAHNA